MPTLQQLTHLASDVMAGKPTKLRSPLWAKVRGEWLKAHPTCSCCGTAKQVEVHHCKPFHLHPELELDPTNFVSLCDGSNSCHRTWGHFYNWKHINPTVREDIATWVQHLTDAVTMPPESD